MIGSKITNKDNEKQVLDGNEPILLVDKEPTMNYGYDFEQEQKDETSTDYQLFSGVFEKIKYDNLVEYRPDGEIQRTSYIDSFMCVLFSLCKCISYRMNWRIKHEMGIEERAWLKQYKLVKDGKFNPSDLFLGILAGVAYGRGTSMKNGVDTARKVGLIAEKLFPFKINAKTWAELTVKPTQEQLDTALKFLERYKLWYENVGNDIEKMKQALEYGPLWVAGASWHNRQADGTYPRVDYTANHCFVVDKYTVVDGPNNDFWDALFGETTEDVTVEEYVRALEAEVPFSILERASL